MCEYRSLIIISGLASLLISVSTAILFYLAATFVLASRFAKYQPPGTGLDARILGLVAAALILHAIVLYRLIFTDAGLNMGFYNALSLVSWGVALLVILFSLVKPTENLLMIILPAAAITLVLGYLLPSERLITGQDNAGLDIHIILSICAYSLLTIAAIQAVILAIQEHQLRARHPVPTMRFLPPLQTMEDLLVQLLWLGFFLLSLSVATGLMFVHDFFAQHLVHKSVLSLLAWFFFALVLFGRWAWGWRGKSLVRWTFAGFFMLMLAYFGTKFVLELILERV